MMDKIDYNDIGTTPLGSQVCSQIFGYKPQDSSGVQQNKLKI